MVGPIEVTANIREVHTRTADMPRVPIERSADIQDHRQVHPAQLTIEGVISAVSIRSDGKIDAQGRVVNGSTDLLGSGEQIFSIQEGYTRLQELFDQKDLFTVTTAIFTYERMHFTSLTVLRDKTTGGVLSFKADLEQVTFADTSEVRVRSKPEDKPVTRKKESPGSKKPVEEDPGSLLLRGAQAVTKSKSPAATIRYGAPILGP